MHYAAVSELFDDKLVRKRILVARTRLNAPYEIGFAFVYFLDKLVQRILYNSNTNTLLVFFVNTKYNQINMSALVLLCFIIFYNSLLL